MDKILYATFLICALMSGFMGELSFVNFKEGNTQDAVQFLYRCLLFVFYDVAVVFYETKRFRLGLTQPVTKKEGNENG